MSEVVPFGDRLLRLLEALQPPRSQKWLAEQSGLSAPTISRYIQGVRNPDVASLESLAPVLGVKPDELVRGTDAEGRLEGQRDWVRRNEFDVALERVVQLEQALGEARDEAATYQRHHELEKRRREAAEEQTAPYLKKLQELSAELDVERADRKQARLRCDELKSENAQLRRQYADAGVQIHRLGEKLDEARAAIEKLDRTSTLTKALAAAAAAASAFTAFKVMSKDDPEEEEGEEDA